MAASSRAVKHGLSKNKEYQVWATMITRCENQNAQNFYNYGGRGITVCSEWRNSFEVFYKDMGPRPTTKHSIDRIENNKGYYKENCRWATAFEQANNTSRNRKITIDGVTKNLAQWSLYFGVSSSTLSRRIEKSWLRPKLKSNERQMSKINKSGQKIITLNGDSKNISEWSRFLGVDRKSVLNRIEKGYPIEMILFKGKLPNHPQKNK